VTGPRVLVTGAAGFVGTAVVAALGPDQPMRLMAHQRPLAAPPGAQVVRADLTDRTPLAQCCAGIDVLVHLASASGRDTERCQAVNVTGTQNLLAEAARAGVREVIYVSSAAVHGHGPHRNLAESARPAPVSAASHSKRLAEQAVLAAGGIVLRPFFTYGDGDRWFVPTVLRWLRTGVWLDAGNACQSVVAVEDLGAVVAAAARCPDAFAGSPFHVCEPSPVRTRDVLLALARLYRLPPPRLSVPAAVTLKVLRLGRLRQLERRLELLGLEHTYQSERVWTAAGRTPGPAMLDRLGSYAPWYESFARAARQGGSR
jgi:nucleoside-diphosphate-sugar epimerase